ncbi:MAG: peptide chain release factor N(5)-glutamine methyltransferase [Roseivirga sp.]
MQMIPAKELATFISSRLESNYDAREAANISHELLRHFFRLDRLHLSLNEPVPFPSGQEEKLLTVIQRLLNQEPLQHITGSVEFYGLEFKSDARALIPRPETEELVHWIIEDHKVPDLTVLDIGTGTGCIPIVLAKNLKAATVSAIDVSEESLTLARENAILNEVSIDLQQLNILEEELNGRYDVMVSNPPYIPEADKTQMSANVLDFEPGLALFVPDSNPLLFYDRIASLAMKSLQPGGTLYFEIHEGYGKNVVELLQNKGFTGVTLKKDLQGKDRMTKATKA